MVQRCSVCSHPSRPEIDRGLINGVPTAPWPGSSASAPPPSAATPSISPATSTGSSAGGRLPPGRPPGTLELLDTRLDRLFNSALDLRSLHVALGCIRESLRLHSQKALLERSRSGRRGQP